MRGEVLVIDDDDGVRESIRMALELEDYAVREAHDGQEGLETLRRERRPCVILLDLMMPVMNGWQFLGALRRDPSLPDPPVVVVSAVPDAAPEGAVAVLRKPFNLDRLLEVVAKYCPHP